MKPVIQIIDVESKEGKLVLTPEKLQELLDQAYGLGYTDGVDSLAGKVIDKLPPITTDPTYPHPYAPQPISPTYPYNPPFQPLNPDIIWCGDDYYRKPLVGINTLKSEGYCVMLRNLNEEGKTNENNEL